MIHSIQERAEREVSWFAIRHPAVLRLLERELSAPDGDAFAVGLELAGRVLDGNPPPRGWIPVRSEATIGITLRRGFLLREPGAAWMDAGHLTAGVPGAGARLGGLRLDHNTLNASMVAVRGGRCDRQMVRSIRAQIDELPVVLAPHEEDAVATVIAAIIWSVLDASARALDDALVA